MLARDVKPFAVPVIVPPPLPCGFIRTWANAMTFDELSVPVEDDADVAPVLVPNELAPSAACPAPETEYIPCRTHKPDEVVAVHVVEVVIATVLCKQ